MPRLHRVSGKYLVSDLTWVNPQILLAEEGQSSDPQKPKKRQQTPKETEAALCRQLKVALLAGPPDNYSVRAFLTGADKKGLVKGSSVSFGAKLYSIAELFSARKDISKLSILVTEVDVPANHYVMCAALDGAPVAGAYDVCVSRTQVSHLLDQWLDDFQQSTSVVPLIYGSWTGAEKNISLAELIDDAVVPRPLRKPSQDKQILIGLAIILVVLGGAYMGYNQYAKQKAIKAARVRAAQEDPLKKYAQQLNTTWAGLAWNDHSVVARVQNELATLPLRIGGFSLGSLIECSLPAAAGANVTNCKLTYLRGVGTYATFKSAAAATFESIVYAPSGDLIEVTYVIKSDVVTPPPDRSALLPEKDLLYKFWPEVQQYSRISANVALPLVLFPTPTVPLNEAGLKESVRKVNVKLVYPFFAGVVTKEMPPTSDVFVRGVSWKKLSFSAALAEESKITLEGDLYVSKKAD